ncbi:AGE family epimerase/isomerase [Pirellulaceae bacterium SH449]
MSEQNRAVLAGLYRTTLLDDVVPFWMRHGIDRDQGGYLTALNRDGSVIDTDKSIWFQGRGAWTFATLFNTIEQRAEWLDAARSGIDFLRRHGAASDGKLYFTVTRDGQPLRMRRYVYSESFASIANAAFARATGDERAAEDAKSFLKTYLNYSFDAGRIPAKTDSRTRPTRGIGPYMIAIATAQELRANLGDEIVSERTCTEWIDWAIDSIEQYFVKPEAQAVMEMVGRNGEILDHFDGRQLNPGHAIECAWFIMHEGKLRDDQRLIGLGLTMLDWMWKRGWDEEHGGLFYFRDLHNLPIQEYWHDMKFWWPHCEAIIATSLAWVLTQDEKYARWHELVHEWSFKHFPDPEYGEWYGYLHRDGRISTHLKGNMWKGPFHLPRMLWYCWQLLDSVKEAAS